MDDCGCFGETYIDEGTVFKELRKDSSIKITPCGSHGKEGILIYRDKLLLIILVMITENV